MNKIIPLLFLSVFVTCSVAHAQKGNTERKSKKSVAESSKAGNEVAPSAQSEQETAESEFKMAEDKVTYLIMGGTGVLPKIAEASATYSNNSFIDPLVVVPHLHDEKDKKYWYGFINSLEENNTLIKNMPIWALSDKSVCVALAINSKEGAALFENYRHPISYSLVKGYKNLEKAKEPHVKAANEKYSLMKIITVANTKYLPGEYGPMKLPLPQAPTLEQ